MWVADSQFDEFLEQQALQLREALAAKDASTIFPEVDTVSFTSEESSVQEVTTAELLWRYLADCGENAAVDYAVLAVGLWKTLETELNRTFIDDICVMITSTTPGVSSVSQHVRQQQKITESGFLANSKKRAVEINRVRNGHFKGLEFGSIIGLLMNHRRNSISEILARIRTPLEEPAMRSERITQAAEQVRIIADKYRNSYAHMHSMARSQCSEFRTRLYDDHRVENPLFLTLHYKEVLLQSRCNLNVWRGSSNAAHHQRAQRECTPEPFPRIAGMSTDVIFIWAFLTDLYLMEDFKNAPSQP